MMLIDDAFSRYGVTPRGIVHIGANLCQERGIYARAGVPDERVLWIEAIPELVASVRANLPPTVRIVQAVVSDRADDVTFYVTNNGGQSSSFLPLAEHRIEHPSVHEVAELRLRTSTLPDILAADAAAGGPSADAYDFLVMDIQGAELHALRGAESILRNFVGIYLEVNVKPLYEGCGLLPEVTDLLERHGFRQAEISMTRHGWGDALFLRLGAGPSHRSSS